MKSVQLDCTQAQAQLPLYAGGDLESPWSEAVAGHLEHCTACGLELRALQAALTPFEHLREAPVSAIDVWPGVRAALESEGRLSSSTTTVRGTTPRVAPRSTLWRRAASLTAAAAVVAAAYVAWPARQPSTVPDVGPDLGSRGVALNSAAQTASEAGAVATENAREFAPEIAREFAPEIAREFAPENETTVEPVAASESAAPVGLGRLRRAAAGEYMGLEAQLFPAPRFGESSAGASLASDRLQRGLR
jgi:hypothetical protein